MKPNFIDPNRTHTHEAIAETNVRIKELFDKILPSASEAFKLAHAKAMDQAGQIDEQAIENLVHDTIAALEGDPEFTVLLERKPMDPSEIDQLDRLRQTQFIDQQCGNLAMGLVCMWEEALLGEDALPQAENLRLAAGKQLLEDLNAGCHSKNAKAVELVASRYYLNAPEAAKILECLVPK